MTRREHDEMELEELAHIELLVELGASHMSRVFEAFDDRLQRTVAVKLLDPRLVKTPEQIERFMREARVAAGLHHPNIVAIHAIGRLDGQYAMVMEYLAGGDLSGRLDALNLDQSSALVKQMAQALDYAHREGVVHRDLKPHNIMFDSHDTPKLVDFGIAKSLGETKLTLDRTFLGTPHYASPEQARGESVDGRSDLYSLGVIFYQMVSKRLPFDSDDPLALLFQHVHEPPPPIDLPDSPAAQRIAGAIHRLLQKDPERRFQSGKDLIKGLDGTTTLELVLPLVASRWRSWVPWSLGLVLVVFLWVMARLSDQPADPIREPVPDVAIMPEAVVEDFSTAQIETSAPNQDREEREDPSDPGERVEALLRQMQFVPIPSGTYHMGTMINRESDARHVHEVLISAFALARTEVTQELWLAVMHGQRACVDAANHPIENVSYVEVERFLAILNQLGVGRFRLPTEAEWEYAARAGRKGRSDVFQSDRSLANEAWFNENSPSQTQPVARKKANEWGLHDMKGNVWEWCSDWYDKAYYHVSPYDNPSGPAVGKRRVVRGGAYNSPAADCRATNRFHWPPDESSCRIGFRLVKEN